MFTDKARSSLRETITRLIDKSNELGPKAASFLDGDTSSRVLLSLLRNHVSVETFERQVNEAVRHIPSWIDAYVETTKQTIQYGTDEGLLHADAFATLESKAEEFKVAKRSAQSTASAESVLIPPRGELDLRCIGTHRC